MCIRDRFMLIPMGHSVNGATRWIRLGFFNFQPAEFVKLAVIISIVAMIMTAGRGINNLKGRLFIICLLYTSCPSNFPVCVCGKKSKGKVITKKAILPSEEELEYNSRAKRAKLRVFERVIDN